MATKRKNRDIEPNAGCGTKRATRSAAAPAVTEPDWINKLYYGDCLTIMNEMPDGHVDLIYLDPPFNSNRDYNAIYTTETGRPLPDQVEAFSDTWELDEERERAIRDMPVLVRNHGISDEVAQFWQHWMNALRQTNPPLLAYLSYMVERLLPMRRILKPTGSIFLHCDDTAGHYIKIMMDGIFGQANFRNEIVWQRAAGRAKGSQHKARTLGRDCDYILHYSMGENYTHNPLTKDLTPAEMEEKFPHVDDKGRRYNTDVPIFCAPKMGARPNLCYEYNGVKNPHPSGWRVKKDVLAKMDANGEIIWRKGKRPLRKSFAGKYDGKPMGCLWTDIPNITGGAENLGYATQKPVALLERIIKMSSTPGDLVFDPFCGCATTIEAAEKLERRWIGIDIAIHAIKRVAGARLRDRLRLAEGKHFEITGVPRDIEGAKDLWTRDPYHFQKWAVEQVDGFVTTKRTGDGGIDGRIYFYVPPQNADDPNPLRSMVLEVKGGRNVGINTVRDLSGVLARDDAEMAGLIILEELGERQRKNFHQEMAQAGDNKVFGDYYSRMQLLTVQDILDGKKFHIPGAPKKEVGQGVLGIEPPKSL